MCSWGKANRDLGDHTIFNRFDQIVKKFLGRFVDRGAWVQAEGTSWRLSILAIGFLRNLVRAALEILNQPMRTDAPSFGVTRDLLTDAA